MAFHIEAFQDWCQHGLTLQQIADKYKVSIYAVQRWSSKEKWREKKKEAEKYKDTNLEIAQEDLEFQKKLEAVKRETARRKKIDLIETKQEEIEETLLERINDHVERTTMFFLGGASFASQMGYTSLRSLYDSEKYKEDGGAAEVRTWVKILQESASMQKSALPDLPEELAAAILNNSEDILLRIEELMKNKSSDLLDEENIIDGEVV